MSSESVRTVTRGAFSYGENPEVDIGPLILFKSTAREGIMADGHTDLHVFDRGNLTGEWQRHEILAPHLQLFRGAYGQNFIYIDDNAQLVDEYLESGDVQ